MLVKTRPSILPSKTGPYKDLTMFTDIWPNYDGPRQTMFILAKQRMLIMQGEYDLVNYYQSHYLSYLFPLLYRLQSGTYKNINTILTPQALAKKIEHQVTLIAKSFSLPIPTFDTNNMEISIVNNFTSHYAPQDLEDIARNFTSKLTDNGNIKYKNGLYMKIHDFNVPIFISFGMVAIHTSSYIVYYIRRCFRHMMALQDIDSKAQARILRKMQESFWKHYITWDSEKLINSRADEARKELLKNNGKIICTIGADPEIELFKTTKAKNGINIPNFKNGFINAEEILNIRDAEEAKLGLDGNRRIIEIRPSASNNPTYVAKDVKRILSKLSTELEQIQYPITPIAGGGFMYSTGGHIHIGHELLKTFETYGKNKDKLINMLDDFLYLPFKRYNPFATRGWAKLPEIQKEFFTDRYSVSYDTVPTVIYTENDEIIKKIMDKKEVSADERYSCYDMKSQWRKQNWGIEYRSMPSFICDYLLTRITLKLAKKITEYFLESAISHKTIIYNSPPEKEDYLKFIMPKEYDIFMDYVKGKKRHLLAKSIFKNWKIKYKICAPPKNTYPFNAYITIDMALCDNDAIRLKESIQENVLIKIIMSALQALAKQIPFVIKQALIQTGGNFGNDVNPFIIFYENYMYISHRISAEEIHQISEIAIDHISHSYPDNNLTIYHQLDSCACGECTSDSFQRGDLTTSVIKRILTAYQIITARSLDADIATIGRNLYHNNVVEWHNTTTIQRYPLSSFNTMATYENIDPSCLSISIYSV